MKTKHGYDTLKKPLGQGRGAFVIEPRTKRGDWKITYASGSGVGRGPLRDTRGHGGVGVGASAAGAVLAPAGVVGLRAHGENRNALLVLAPVVVSA